MNDATHRLHTPANTFTIGSLAQKAGVGVETVRYYQRRSLLDEPTRPWGGIRRYDAGHLQRLRFIRAAQDLGFSLEQVRELLHLSDGLECTQAQQLASAKLSQIRERLARLARMESVLEELLARCQTNSGTTACPLIEALGKHSNEPNPAAAPDS